MQHARNDQTCVTVLMQVTKKLHSCCMWQLNIVLFCVQETYQFTIQLYSVKSADVMRLFFFYLSVVLARMHSSVYILPGFWYHDTEQMSPTVGRDYLVSYQIHMNALITTT